MGWYVFIFIFCLTMIALHYNTKSNTNKKIIEIIILFVLIIFSGTRYRLGGWDYGIYEKVFNEVPKLNEFTINTTNSYGTEIGYLFLNSIIKTLGFNFYGFTLIHSIIFYTILYKAIKKYNINFGFFIIVFLYKLCIFNTFVSLRQSIVLAIFFYAIEYLIKNKKIKYVICILISTFFHTSSLILFPLLFINKLEFSKKQLILYCTIFALFFILNISNIYIFNPINIITSIFGNNSTILGKADMYFSSSISINILSTLECYIIVILLITFYNQVHKTYSNEKKIMINLFLILIPIVTLFRSFEVIIRFRDYFSLYIPFVLYYIYSSLKTRDKLMYLLAVTAICFVGYYRYIYTYDNELRHYESYLTKNISIIGDD